MAIKILNSFDKQVFQKEFLPLANLSHRNIVKLIGETKALNFRAIIMEHMEGGDLGKAIHDKTVAYSLNDILWWNFQSASALEYMHSLRHIHRDIKPQNMLLDSAYKLLKICDFGQSKAMNKSSLTSNVGTLTYTAPEVVLGDHYNEKCDVYSWTLTFWECFTRKHPFSDCRNVAEILSMKYVRDYRLDEISGISGELNKLIENCSSYEPQLRLSMSVIKDYLESLLKDTEYSRSLVTLDDRYAQQHPCLWSMKDDKLYYCDGSNFSHWEHYQDVPALSYMINVSFDRKIFFYGAAKMNRFDIRTKKWEVLPGMPKSDGRHYSCAELIDLDKNIVILRDIEKNEKFSNKKKTVKRTDFYDVRRNVWKRLPLNKDFNKYEDISLASVDDGLMLVCSSSLECKHHVQLYNYPTDKWHKIEPPRYYYYGEPYSLISHDENVYITNGIRFEEYVVKEDKWKGLKSPFEQCIANIQLISMNNSILAIAKELTGKKSLTVKMFNERYNKWFPVGSIPIEYSDLHFVVA